MHRRTACTKQGEGPSGVLGTVWCGLTSVRIWCALQVGDLYITALMPEDVRGFFWVLVDHGVVDGSTGWLFFHTLTSMATDMSGPVETAPTRLLPS